MTSRTSLSSKKIILQYKCSINKIEFLLIYYQFNYSLKRDITYQNMLQVKQSLALMESL